MAEAFEDHNRLITVRAGLDPADAQLLKSLLEANGVQVFASNENMGSLHYGVSIDLMVRAIDKVRADAVLGKVVTMPRCAVATQIDEDGEEVACQHCGSERVHPFVGSVPTFIPGLRFEARKGSGWYHCLQCHSYFRNRRSRMAGFGIALMWGATLALATLGVIWLIQFLRWL